MLAPPTTTTSPPLSHKLPADRTHIIHWPEDVLTSTAGGWKKDMCSLPSVGRQCEDEVHVSFERWFCSHTHLLFPSPTLHCHIVTVWWPITSQNCDCFYPVVRLNHLHIVNFSSLITMHLILFLDKKGFICGWVSYFLYKNIVRHARLYGKKFMCIYIHTHVNKSNVTN